MHSTGGKITIRTMQGDLQNIKPVQQAVLPTSMPMPPKNLPTAKPEPQKPQKPIIKIREVIDKEKTKKFEQELKKQYEKREKERSEQVKKILNRKPIIKIQEKIVEKPVIQIKEKIIEKPVIVTKTKEVVKKIKVPVIKEKNIYLGKSRRLKQVIAILIFLTILSTIGVGTYYLLSLPGEKIIIQEKKEEIMPTESDIPKPEPIQEPIPNLLPNIPQIIQTKTEEPLNLPKNLIFTDYNILIFPNKTRGLVLQIENTLDTLAEMIFWEPQMSQDLKILNINSKKAKFRVNNWEYPNIIIRFQNVTDLSHSLHYTLIKNKLIITTAEQDMRLIINALLYES